MRKLIGLALIFAVGLAAQTQTPVPIAAPPDVLTSQTSAAIALTSYKAWVESSLASHDTSIQTLWSAKLANDTEVLSLQSQINKDATDISAMKMQIATLQAQILPVVSSVIRVEAEDAVLSSGPIVSEVTSDLGGGKDLAQIADTQWYEYHRDIPMAGTYAMIIRAATPNGTRSIHVEFPVGTNASGALPVPNTGGYQAWTSIPVGNKLIIPQGVLVFRVVCDTGRLNLNYYEFTRQN